MSFPGYYMPTKTAAERKLRNAAFAAWVAAENERVRRQRIYTSTLRGPIRDGLVSRLLERAWALLDAGECEAADALLEFAPEADAMALLNEFFDDDAAVAP